MKNLGFTLAEVLITLVIIGVIAAMTVPTLMNNTNAQEYRSALKKAISGLNQALTLHYALDGSTASDFSTAELLVDNVFKARMSTVDSSKFTLTGTLGTVDGSTTVAFTTADGMKYCVNSQYDVGTNENEACNTSNTIPCTTGATANSAVTTPNLIIDVNGDRKPNPANVDCKSESCSYLNKRKYSDPLGLKLTDLFTIMITDKQAIPYGVAAQRAMYQAQK